MHTPGPQSPERNRQSVIEALDRVWQQSLDPADRRATPLRAYLSRRGLASARLDGGVVRFHPALGYWQRALAAREEAGDAERIRIARWTVARGMRAVGRLDDAERVQLAGAGEARQVGEGKDPEDGFGVGVQGHDGSRDGARGGAGRFESFAEVPGVFAKRGDHGEPVPGAAYADVPRTCDGCHASDYEASEDPGHVRLALPRTCQTCHGTLSWDGATLGALHRFPITSGRHAGAACTTCHPAGRAWVDFTCLSCHEHRQTETDGHHAEVPGYSYDTAACYRCHPQGTAED